MSEVLNELEKSLDKIDQALARALREWQNYKALQNKRRDLGYDPRDIRKYGSREVITRRVKAGSSGFNEVPMEYSYEAIVTRFPSEFDPAIVDIASKRLEQEYAIRELTPDPELLNERVSQLLTKEKNALKFPQGASKPEITTREITAFYRDPRVKAYVLKMAQGRCQACNSSAPFKSKDGQDFLELHHVKPLAEGGSDKVENAVALCPNCHRALHHASDAMERREMLYAKISTLEK
ncbi:HNH endonuclease [Acetobacter orientalis]|uniref:HNH endonuclease n=1 Tax=Acetobacter orientalis TaxID=146474 RepID=UPI000A36717F|nr:HNH endonuclease signature motif containing protein [Acetobacter orientalis]